MSSAPIVVETGGGAPHGQRGAPPGSRGPRCRGRPQRSASSLRTTAVRRRQHECGGEDAGQREEHDPPAVTVDRIRWTRRSCWSWAASGRPSRRRRPRPGCRSPCARRRRRACRRIGSGDRSACGAGSRSAPRSASGRRGRGRRITGSCSRCCRSPDPRRSSSGRRKTTTVERERRNDVAPRDLDPENHSGPVWELWPPASSPANAPLS